MRPAVGPAARRHVELQCDYRISWRRPSHVVVPRANALLSRPREWVAVQAEHDDAFARLRADVGVQAADFGAEHVANHRFQDRPTVVHEFLPGLLHQVAAALAVARFGELDFARRQDALEPDQHHVVDDERPGLERTATHDFFFEANHGLADLGFEFAEGFVAQIFQNGPPPESHPARIFGTLRCVRTRLGQSRQLKTCGGRSPRRIAGRNGRRDRARECLTAHRRRPGDNGRHEVGDRRPAQWIAQRCRGSRLRTGKRAVRTPRFLARLRFGWTDRCMLVR